MGSQPKQSADGNWQVYIYIYIYNVLVVSSFLRSV